MLAVLLVAQQLGLLADISISVGLQIRRWILECLQQVDLHQVAVVLLLANAPMQLRDHQIGHLAAAALMAWGLRL